MKTLREICLEVGVSRRAVQGYEEAGLVKATRKNKYGYLLYDQKAQERIELIKFFRDLKFTVKEIGALIDTPKDNLKSILEERVQEMERELETRKETVQRAKAFIKEL